MLSKSTSNNPFRYKDPFRMWQVYNMLSDGKIGRLLDFGCGNGYFLGKLKNKVEGLYGCDPYGEPFEKKSVNFEDVKFEKINPHEPLPYPDCFFDVVTAIEVIEHVGDEKRVIRELYRILKNGGVLIITVPNKGIFDFLDRGNLKFNFPKLHKFLYSRFYGKENYLKHFVNEKNMYGDVTITDNSYHKHYNLKNIKELLRDEFEIKQYCLYSFFAPFIIIFMQIINILFNELFRSFATKYPSPSSSAHSSSRQAARYSRANKNISFLRKILHIDGKIFHCNYSY